MTPVGASESPPTSRLRARVEALCELRRESASDGERASADWISAELGRLGLRARIEEERATGGYWRALGLLSALSLGGALAALRGRRIVGTVVGLLAAAAVYDDLDLHGRVVRRALAWRRTHNVICELGELSAPHTAVLVAHHDAAHSGLIFHPKPSELMIRYAPKLVARANSDPPIWAPVIAAPGLTALGAATGWRPASRAGVLLAAIVTAVLGDVARRDPVPGAIDNASGVAALIELAGHLKAHPPTNLRVLLVWTGAEEALWEGMEGFARRHFRNLRPDSTFILNVDQVGDPVFTVLRGEGALRIREYPPQAVRLVEDAARDLGLPLISGLCSRSGSDGQYALKCGYPAAFLGSVTEHKSQTAYHWPTDTPHAVTWSSVGAAVEVCETVLRRLEDRWLD